MKNIITISTLCIYNKNQGMLYVKSTNEHFNKKYYDHKLNKSITLFMKKEQ